jgi:hypothetical protein
MSISAGKMVESTPCWPPRVPPMARFNFTVKGRSKGQESLRHLWSFNIWPSLTPSAKTVTPVGVQSMVYTTKSLGYRGIA